MKTFRKLFHEYNSYSKKLKQDHGLNTSHIACLMYLSGFKRKTISNLSTHLSLAPSTVTSLIDALIKKKFINKNISHSDKRITYISITKSGISFLKKAPQIFEDKLVEGVHYLSDQEKGDLSRIMNKVLLNIDRNKREEDVPIKIFWMDQS